MDNIDIKEMKEQKVIEEDKLREALALHSDFELFSDYFDLKKVNGLFVARHLETGLVAKRCKTRPVMDKWIKAAVNALRIHVS